MNDKPAPWLRKAHPHPCPPLPPIDRGVPFCDDQLPIFARVGRGPSGDSCKIQYREEGGHAYLDVYTVHSDGTEELDGSYLVDGGVLSYSYHLEPDPGFFTITFAYESPVPELCWEWTTPGIPYMFGTEGDLEQSAVKAVYTYEYPDGEPVDQLVYPPGTGPGTWHTPANGQAWSVGLSYGDELADIPCPTFDQMNEAIAAAIPDIPEIPDFPLAVSDGGTGTGSGWNDDDLLQYDLDNSVVKGISYSDLLTALGLDFDTHVINVSSYYSTVQHDPVYNNTEEYGKTACFPPDMDVSGTITFSRFGRYCNIAIRIILKPYQTLNWGVDKRYVLLPANREGMYNLYPDGYIAYGPADHIEAPMHCRKQNSSTITDYEVQDGITLDANWWAEYAGNSIWIGNDYGQTISLVPTSGSYPFYIIEGSISYMQGDHIPAERLLRFSIEEIPAELRKEYNDAKKESK